MRWHFLGIAIALTFAASPLWASAEGDEPIALFLTWQRDPTTTMTVDWHTDDIGHESRLEYRALGSADWISMEGTAHPFPHSERTIHRVELTGLAPGGTYEFRIDATSNIYRFQTMPADLLRPLRIAIGGDVRHSQEMMERTNRVAMEYNPDFIIWGGDLAYANADPRYVDRWYEWFDAIRNTLIDENGRIVPIVVTLGNHEVFWRPRYSGENAHLPDEWGYENHDAVFFYDLFAFPKPPGYAMLDFGNYLSLALLNTDHGTVIPGEQAEWLASSLEARRGFQHIIPIYHVPAYPSVREYDGWASPDVREHWSPIFEAHGVRVAFEHHDHAYKRTHPIRAERVHEGGIVYLGDGAWGVETREIHPSETWYLAHAASERHFILLTLQGNHQHVLIVNDAGEVIDEYPPTPLGDQKRRTPETEGARIP